MGLSPELARLRIVDNTAKRMQMLSDFGFDARPTPKVSQMLLEVIRTASSNDSHQIPVIPRGKKNMPL